MRRLALGLSAACVVALAAGCQETTVRTSGGKQLTMTVPAGAAIRRGQTMPVEIGIRREGVEGGVTVSISQLPAGVSARESSKTVETDAATFVLTAEESAALVTNHAVQVTVRAPDGATARDHMRLTVRE